MPTSGRLRTLPISDSDSPAAAPACTCLTSCLTLLSCGVPANEHDMPCLGISCWQILCNSGLLSSKRCLKT